LQKLKDKIFKEVMNTTREKVEAAKKRPEKALPETE
jgi:hypothetical protein